MRIGHGYDAHRYKSGRKCIICGVEIPCDFGPDGHSDADVATHALMDALLGAAALGDIGKMFPDTDDEYLGANSLELLGMVVERINNSGYDIENCDITIIAQGPKMGPHIGTMRAKIAEAMKVDIGAVSIKATTEEKMGFTGSYEGIRAHAVVLIDKRKTHHNPLTKKK